MKSRYKPKVVSRSKAKTRAPSTACAKRSAAMKAVWARPGEKAKRGAAIKAALSRPEVKAKRGAAIKAALNRPESKAKRSAVMKASHARPEVRARISAGSKAAHARPEVPKGGETESRPRGFRRRRMNRPEVKAQTPRFCNSSVCSILRVKAESQRCDQRQQWSESLRSRAKNERRFQRRRMLVLR